VVSHYTATGPHWIDKPYGYWDQVSRLGEIRAADIEITPIIEPGTEKQGEMPSILAQHFVHKQPVDGFNPAELRKFDVIFAHTVFNMQPEMAKALVAAVKDGVGYVQQAGGAVNPGYTADLNLLAGMNDGEYGWNGGPVNCEIVGDHPLLGELSGATGTVFRATPNGHFGELIGVPLIRVEDRSQIAVPRGRPLTHDFYPLYVSQLGKGRIVGIAFAHYQPIPQELQKATGGKFLQRCIRWAANRPLDTIEGKNP
jgi:hypothetical protein